MSLITDGDISQPEKLEQPIKRSPSLSLSLILKVKKYDISAVLVCMRQGVEEPSPTPPHQEEGDTERAGRQECEEGTREKAA